MYETQIGQAQPQQPSILLEGLPLRSNTFPKQSSGNAGNAHGLPYIAEDDTTQLSDLLREHQIIGTGKPFWSLKLLRHIFTRARVSAELVKFSTRRNIERFADLICVPQNAPQNAANEVSYTRIFALLLLLDKENDFEKFVEEDLSDTKLPLCFHMGTREARRKRYLFLDDASTTRLRSFETWTANHRESFEGNQWQVLVPCFEMKANRKINFYDLHDNTILPWVKLGVGCRSSSEPSLAFGGYAEVSCVGIDHTSHEFQDVLKAIRIGDGRFARKQLTGVGYDSDDQFRKELSVLKEFSGLVHDHLITLLTCFRHLGRYSFLFPYADCALDQYWETPQKYGWNQRKIRWVAKQCAGIMGAINTMHNAEHLGPDEPRRYGLHGDIRPDNILWFESPDDEDGILVICDLGISSLHRDVSRSNIPNKAIPRIPQYRPPECDVLDGQISRAYDIWTLGCLFLDMMTWLMGGMGLLSKFREQRITTYITGINNDIFYTLKMLDNQSDGSVQIRDGPDGVIEIQKGQKRDWYAIQVKPQVAQWISRLHGHSNCSDYIHSILNIVEEEMLVVLSRTARTRSESRVLLPKFNELQARCETDDDFCFTGKPKPTVSRVPTAIVVDLNPVAKTAIQENNPKLPIHDHLKEKTAT